MQGWKLLLAQPFLIDGVTPDGEVVITVDSLARARGRGEMVVIYE